MPSIRIVVAFFVGAGLAASVSGQEGGAVAARAVRVDFQGDPLPEDALVRIGTTRLRHGHDAKDVAFSPDGSMLASAGYDHAIRLWDAATGKELRRFRKEEERTDAFTVSRWQACVAFSPDGKRLACGEYAGSWSANHIRVFEVATGKLLYTIQGSRGGVPALAFAPDGSRIASAGIDGTITLWDSATGEARLRLTGHEGAVWSVVWSPKGDLIATAGQDRTIRLWNPAGGPAVRQFVGHEAEVKSVSFSPHGQFLVSGSSDKTVRLWETGTGKERAVLGQHGQPVARVAFAPDGKTVASSSSGYRAIKLWDVAGNLVRTFEGHQSIVRGLVFSPDGKTLASASDEGTVGVWDVATGTERVPLPGHRAALVMLGFLDNRTLVSLSRDETIRWWDWKQGKEERVADWKHVYPGRATDFSPGRDLLSVGSRQSPLRLLETKTGKDLGPPDDVKRLILSASFSPDGRILATVDNEDPTADWGMGASLWDVKTRKIVRRVASDVNGLQLVLLAPNGKLLLGGGGTSHLWDIEKDKQVGPTLPLSLGRLRSAAFTPDSRYLASGNLNGNVEVWDFETGDRVRVLTGLAGYIMTLSVSPDSRLLAAGGWCGVKVWEIETGLERRSFHDLEGNAFAVAFSPDGRALATGNGAQEIVVWDIPGQPFLADPKVAASEVVLRLWTDLAGADGVQVHRAIWGLAARPEEATAFLKKTLTPTPAIDGPRLAQAIEDLNSDLFVVRDKATKEIETFGDAAEPALRRVVIDPPSLEVKQRAKSLLEKLAASRATPARLQKQRALEALEHMATREAQALLQELASGAAESRISREAIAALERLGKQKGGGPSR